MKPLPQSFRKNGYDYTMIKRNDQAVIYEQKISPTVSRFEVHVIKRCEDRYIKDVFVQAHESLQSTESFGLYAWTCWGRDKADLKFSEIYLGG